MITGNIPEKSTDNKQISMSIQMNTAIFQDMSPMNPVVEHQEQAHQQHERKDAMSTRIIDETTLRIYYLQWLRLLTLMAKTRH